MSGNNNLVCWTNVHVGRYNIQWRIQNYSYLPMEEDEALISPTFLTGKNQVEWRIHLLPQGAYEYAQESGESYSDAPDPDEDEDNTFISDADEDDDNRYISDADEEVYVAVFLELRTQVEISASFKISLLSKHKEKFKETETGHHFYGPVIAGSFFLINKAILFEQKNVLLDNDTLVVNLELEVVEKISNSSFSPPIISKDINQISEDYLNLLNSSVMSDFIINVKSRRFNVHKLILTARSPVFAAMISGGLKESRTNVLNIKDVDPDVMACVIHYIYSGKCYELKQMAKEILPVADKYGLEHLKFMCEEVLCSQLNLDNIVSIICLADMYSAQKLKEKSIDFICDNFKNVLESPDWKNMVSMNKDLALEIWPAVVNKNILVKQIRLN